MRKVILILLALAAIRLLPRALRREALALELIAAMTRFMLAASANTAKTQNIEQRVNALVTEGIPQAIAQALESGTLDINVGTITCTEITSTGTGTIDGNFVSHGSINCTSFAATGLAQLEGGIRITGGQPTGADQNAPSSYVQSWGQNADDSINRLIIALWG